MVKVFITTKGSEETSTDHTFIFNIKLIIIWGNIPKLLV